MLVNCTPDKQEEYDGDFGRDYFPLTTGAYWEYKVDSVVYSMLGEKIDSSSNTIQERLVEELDKTQDYAAYRLERSIFNSTDSIWISTDQWKVEKSDVHVYRTEENRKFNLMNFPVQKNARWDGNAHFNAAEITVDIGGEELTIYKDWQYKVVSLDLAEEIAGKMYDKVLTIQQVDNYDNSLEQKDKQNRKIVIEKYAKGIGLVYKKQLILETDCFTDDCYNNIPWEKKATKGYILEQHLLNYGR